MQLAAVSDISERRREVHPQRFFTAAGRAFEAVIMTLFAAIGWLAGAFFGLAVNIALAVEYGFRAGAHWPQRKPAEDETPPGD